jgi:Nitrate and nitrite sensing.
MTLMAGSTPGATEWFQRARVMRREQLSKLAQLGVLVSGISRLVHMLQCERGASNVWLCSQGKLYAPECKASRGLVDENLAALYDMSKAERREWIEHNLERVQMGHASSG